MTAQKKIALGIACSLVFGICLFVVIPATVRVPPSVNSGLNSPAFWPTTLSAFLILLGLLQCVDGLREVFAGPRRVRADVARVALDIGLAELKVLGGIVLLVTYYVMTIWLGIVVSSIFSIAAFMLAYGIRQPILIAGLAVIVPLGLYAFFVYLAHLPLPMGIFS